MLPLSPQSRYMALALEEARAAEAAGETPVGAIAVRGDKIVGRGHNLTRALYDPTAHAEIVALRRACEALRLERAPECDLYVTLEPCPMCAQAISFARVRRLYFGAYDPKGGGTESGAQIFNQKSCFHRPEIYGGVMEKECGEILRNFFASKR